MFLARHQTAAGGGTSLANKASKRFTRFSENELEYLFLENPDEADTSEAGKYIFLPIVPKPRMLPVLSMYYKVPDDEARLQLALFMDQEGQQEDRAFGYRYESPEGHGRHHFWHAQPILEMRRHDNKMIALPGITDGWRPADTPAFPLSARCNLDLIVCLIVSIYGYQEAWNMQANGFQGRLAGKLRELRPPTP
jgi:hypothetical protein